MDGTGSISQEPCQLFRFRTVSGRGRPGKMKVDCFELLLTQTDLSDACGLSTVHVNRSPQALRKENLIVLENHTLCIPNIGALMDSASFDPGYLYL